MSTCFCKRKTILNVALVANEIMDKLLFRNRDGVLCKLDMEKPYNHVNWDFLDYMLRRLGFRDK